MGDDDTNAIGVAAFDESHSPGCVGLRVSAHFFQSLFEVSQALGGVCRPHQQVVPDSARVVLRPLATLDEVELEASGCKEEGRIARVNGLFTSEQVPVEVHRSVEFCHELDR